MAIHLQDMCGDMFRELKGKEYYLYGYKNRNFDEVWNNDYWEGDKELEIICREHFELGKKAYEIEHKKVK